MTEIKETDLLLYGLGLPEEIAKDLMPVDNDPRFIEKRKRQQEFLHAYVANCAMLTKTCKQIPIDPTTVRYWRKTDPIFTEAYDIAKRETIEILEEEGIRRALEGVDRKIFHQGILVDTVKDYSDLLLMFMLKKLDPSYRENATANIGIMGQDFTIQFVDPDQMEKGKLKNEI